MVCTVESASFEPDRSRSVATILSPPLLYYTIVCIDINKQNVSRLLCGNGASLLIMYSGSYCYYLPQCVDRPCEELLQDLYISSNSVSKLVVTNKNAVWCGAGKTVTVVNIE